MQQPTSHPILSDPMQICNECNQSFPNQNLVFLSCNHRYCVECLRNKFFRFKEPKCCGKKTTTATIKENLHQPASSAMGSSKYAYLSSGLNASLSQGSGSGKQTRPSIKARDGLEESSSEEDPINNDENDENETITAASGQTEGNAIAVASKETQDLLSAEPETYAHEVAARSNIVVEGSEDPATALEHHEDLIELDDPACVQEIEPISQVTSDRPGDSDIFGLRLDLEDANAAAEGSINRGDSDAPIAEAASQSATESAPIIQNHSVRTPEGATAGSKEAESQGETPSPELTDSNNDNEVLNSDPLPGRAIQDVEAEPIDRGKLMEEQDPSLHTTAMRSSPEGSVAGLMQSEARKDSGSASRGMVDLENNLKNNSLQVTMPPGVIMSPDELTIGQDEGRSEGVAELKSESAPQVQPLAFRAATLPVPDALPDPLEPQKVVLTEEAQQFFHDFDQKFDNLTEIIKETDYPAICEGVMALKSTIAEIDSGSISEMIERSKSVVESLRARDEGQVSARIHELELSVTHLETEKTTIVAQRDHFKEKYATAKQKVRAAEEEATRLIAAKREEEKKANVLAVKLGVADYVCGREVHHLELKVWRGAAAIVIVLLICWSISARYLVSGSFTAM